MITRSALLQLFPSRWDREFESAFLQLRVICEPRRIWALTSSSRQVANNAGEKLEGRAENLALIAEGRARGPESASGDLFDLLSVKESDSERLTNQVATPSE